MKIEVMYSDNYSEVQLSRLEKFSMLAGQEEKQVASVNMDIRNWEQNNASLLYLLLREKRFSKEKGGLFTLLNKDEVIAVSGFYQSDFNPEVYVFGCRSWVLKEHRLNLLIAEKLLPAQLVAIEHLGGKAAIISFNESTKAFAKLIERSNKSIESTKKFFFGERYPGLYHDMILHQNPVFIKNSKQWILIKYLKSFKYDWKELEIQV